MIDVNQEALQSKVWEAYAMEEFEFTPTLAPDMKSFRNQDF